MKRQRRAVTAISRLLSWALIILLIAGLLGFVIYWTRGLTRDFSTVYLNVNENRYLSGDLIVVKPNKEIPFFVKNAFGSVAQPSDVDYSVQILPIDDKTKDFEYSVDGKRYSFVLGTLDLTSGCRVQKFDDYFTLQLSFELFDILQATYPGRSVECPRRSLIDDSYLRAVVTIGDITMIFPLQVDGCVTGIEVLPGEVIF